LVEQKTLNLWVLGSSPSGVTVKQTWSDPGLFFKTHYLLGLQRSVFLLFLS
jgi:hypothetical protein